MLHPLVFASVVASLFGLGAGVETSAGTGTGPGGATMIVAANYGAASCGGGEYVASWYVNGTCSVSGPSEAYTYTLTPDSSVLTVCTYADTACQTLQGNCWAASGNGACNYPALVFWWFRWSW